MVDFRTVPADPTEEMITWIIHGMTEGDSNEVRQALMHDQGHRERILRGYKAGLYAAPHLADEPDTRYIKGNRAMRNYRKLKLLWAHMAKVLKPDLIRFAKRPTPHNYTNLHTEANRASPYGKAHIDVPVYVLCAILIVVVI